MRNWSRPLDGSGLGCYDKYINKLRNVTFLQDCAPENRDLWEGKYVSHLTFT